MGIFSGYIIVSDMDGTLLNRKGKLSDENINAIKYFVNNGGKFTLATGRMLPSVKRHVNKINVNLPVIIYNGVKVYDCNNDEVIWERHLEENKKRIVQDIKKNNPNLGIEIYSEEVVYIFQSCKQTERFKNLGYDVVYEVNDDIWNKKWTKVLIIGSKEELDNFEKSYHKCPYFRGMYREESYHKEYEDALIRSSDIYLEMIPEGISKGQALKELINKNNIINHTVIAVGDNMNDLELLEEADYGFCTLNGSEKLKKLSKYIACSNDDNVMEFLIKWIEKEKIFSN